MVEVIHRREHSTAPDKYRWWELMGPCWGQWCTRITGGVLFHSVFYNSYQDPQSLSVSAYNKLGTTCSHGCIRLTSGDAKWIYDNCASGVKIVVYSKDGYEPFLSRHHISFLVGIHGILQIRQCITNVRRTDATNGKNLRFSLIL